jgi:hypothetical protein
MTEYRLRKEAARKLGAVGGRKQSRSRLRKKWILHMAIVCVVALQGYMRWLKDANKVDELISRLESNDLVE